MSSVTLSPSARRRQACMPERVERPECFISVDVETAGPNPSNYAMLSIGACLVDDPAIGFYVELKPDKAAVAEHALEVGGFSMDSLAASGLDAGEALQDFADWLTATVPEGHAPVFVGFNAPFDWMFVSDYFWRYLGHNPFGHSSLDIKAYYLGVAGSTWARTSLR